MSKKRSLPSWMKNAAERVSDTSGNSSQGNHGQVSSSGDARAGAIKLPMLQFEGKLIYSYHSGDCSIICEDIRSSSPDGCVVGFDMEWPVTYTSGPAAKTAVIQLCTAADICYIFHISAMSGFPKALKDLITDRQFKKVGVNIEGDLWKLARDFDNFPARDVIQESMVDLSTYANSVLNSAEKWSLDGLAQHLLNHHLKKTSDVRCGRWDNYPLTDEQKTYAATDAYASLMVFEKLKQKEHG